MIKLSMKDAIYNIMIGNTVLVNGNELVWTDKESNKTKRQITYYDAKTVDDDMELIYQWLEDGATFELWKKE